MNKIYCEICKRNIDVPSIFNIKDAIEIHTQSHSRKWVDEAIEFINKQKSDKAVELMNKLKEIQNDFVKPVNISDKENSNGSDKSVRCSNSI